MTTEPPNVIASVDSMRELPRERLFSALKNRFLQVIALYGPGADTLRGRLHRWRGVKVGTGVHIGIGVLIETSYPQWVWIGNGVQIGIRSTIIAHMHGLAPRRDQHKGHISVRIEDEVNIGAGVIVLPNVTIGHGAVVTAGSVVTRSIPPLTMVQGNPAKPIAKCGIPLSWGVSFKEFLCKLKPLEENRCSTHGLILT